MPLGILPGGGSSQDEANGEEQNHFSSAQVTGASSPMPPTPVVTRATDINTDPGYPSAMDTDLSPCRSLGPDVTVVIALILVWPQSQHGPPTSTWQLRPEQHMAPGGRTPISASSSLPAFLQFRFSPQCRTHSASSLPFPIILAYLFIVVVSTCAGQGALSRPVAVFLYTWAPKMSILFFY